MSYYGFYSRTQTIVLQPLPYLSAPPSAIGSALIIYTIAVDKYLEIGTYHRLILGMSIMDFISSFGFTAFGHWAVPAGTNFVVGASGNGALKC